jgi:hypothetical protein
MPTLQETIRSFGGIAARRELLAAGHTDDEIRIFARGGAIQRIRNGWYAVPGNPLGIVQAWRVGGRLGCVSAVNHWGYALPDNGELHVCVNARSVRLRHPDIKSRRLRDCTPSNLVIHWGDSKPMDQLASGRRAAVSVASGLDQILRCPRAVEAAATVLTAGMRMPAGNGNR